MGEQPKYECSNCGSRLAAPVNVLPLVCPLCGHARPEKIDAKR
jgi:DNA-directed RNA polymerase subunit RPC12/RpoP